MTIRYWLQILLVSLLGWLPACQSDVQQAGSSAMDAPIHVRIAEARPASAGTIMTAVGTVRLRRESELGFTTPGRIATIAVDEGDRVKRGQLLAALDTTTVGADLASAVAEKQRTAAALQRASALFSKGWLTRARLDDAESAYRSATAAADAASFAARTARITAPADGIVLRRLAEANQVVPAGSPVLVFGDVTSGYVLRVPLTDRQAATLDTDAVGNVAIAALNGESLAARVIEISGRADEATGAFIVELALPAHPALRSGQVGTAKLSARAAAKTADIVIIPSSALFAARAGEAFVYVVDPDTRRVRLRKIVAGETGDEGVTVLAGLIAGEQIAVTGISRLRPGASVSAMVAPPV